MDPALRAFGLAFAAFVLSTIHQRRERAASRTLAAEQRTALAELSEEVSSLREALLASGAVERLAKPPPGPSLAEPSPPAEPPSTKPVQSRTVRAPLRSDPPLAPSEDVVQRAMRRIERHAKVPPEVAARWEQRLRALGAELGLPEDAEPTDSQIGRVIRELYEAEADVKDAHPAAPPPLEATLASAASPIAIRIAETATRPADADGETTLRREGDRPAALPRPNADDESGDGEEMTKVFSKEPDAADAQIPGVEVKPLPPTVRPPPRSITDPLAGVALERRTSSATRTADAFRGRTTLPGGVTATPGGEREKGGEP